MIDYDPSELRSGRASLVTGIIVIFVLSLWLAPAHYTQLSWSNIVMPAIVSLYAAAFLACIILRITAAFIGLRGYGLSIGMLGNMPIAAGRYVAWFVGVLPIVDISIPISILSNRGSYWTMTALPSILVVGCGALCMYFCETNADILVQNVAVFNMTVRQIVAIFALACILNGVVFEIMIFDKLKEAFPQTGCRQTFSQQIIIFAFIFCIPAFVTFFKTNVLLSVAG